MIGRFVMGLLGRPDADDVRGHDDDATTLEAAAALHEAEEALKAIDATIASQQADYDRASSELTAIADASHRLDEEAAGLQIGAWRGADGAASRLDAIDIGFNEANYASFETAHSRSKAAKGGKGIGRLVWLKAFERAEVESFYAENGKFWRRRFDFTLSDDGLINPTLEEIEQREQETSVRLVGFKPSYRDKVPRQTPAIARRIVEHCLEYFVMGSAPKMLLIDDQTMEQTDLGDLFTKDVLDSSMVHDFRVKERDFRITHVQVATGQEVSHRLNFCAHKRTVKTEHLGPKIPNLTPSLKDHEKGERPFVYYGYVSGPYLDETVSAQRTGFDVVEDGLLRTDADLSWEDMLEGSLGHRSRL